MLGISGTFGLKISACLLHFLISMASSFLQLMSKETISPFGPELSGDLEQQVSVNTETPEKETNLKRV